MLVLVNVLFVVVAGIDAVISTVVVVIVTVVFVFFLVVGGVNVGGGCSCYCSRCH